MRWVAFPSPTQHAINATKTTLFAKSKPALRQLWSIEWTDRKFNPQFTSAEYTLNPLSSTTPLCSPQPTINFRSKTTFVWWSQRFDARNRQKMHNACNPDLADHTTHRTTPRQRLIHTNPRSAACAISAAQGYHPNVWSNSSSGIGFVSTPALCNNRSCPASALRSDVWSNSSSGTS